MRNKNGFSLLEIMIVIGMMSGVGLMVMNITKQSTRSSAKFDFDSDKTQITNEIAGILANSVKCKSVANLLGKNAANDTSITSINSQYYSLLSTTPAPPAIGYGNSGVQIDSYQLSATAAELATNTTNLLIKFKGKSFLGNQGLITKKIKLNIFVDGSGNILDCNAYAAGSVNSQWISSGTYIYYPNGGNVGIGTTTAPATKLEVNGFVRPAAATLTAACSPIGAQAYNAATGAPIYCSSALVWTAATSVGYAGPLWSCPCPNGYTYLMPENDSGRSCFATGWFAFNNERYFSTCTQLQ
jgi:hypothetical protein